MNIREQVNTLLNLDMTQFEKAVDDYKNTERIASDYGLTNDEADAVRQFCDRFKNQFGTVIRFGTAPVYIRGMARMVSGGKMREILEKCGVPYSDDPVINFLQYFIDREDVPAMSNDEFRRNYDLDCVWLEGDLHADTIFSFWMIMKQVLQLVAKNRYEEVGNTEEPYKNNRSIYEIINNLNEFLPKKNELVKKLYEFAILAQGRANVMRLPDKGRGIQKRGLWFYDQMGPTLCACFDGKFSEFFNNDISEIEKWVKAEKLQMFFKDEKITLKNVKPLIDGVEAKDAIWLSDEKQLNEMLTNCIDILKKREIELQE